MCVSAHVCFPIQSELTWAGYHLDEAREGLTLHPLRVDLRDSRDCTWDSTWNSTWVSRWLGLWILEPRRLLVEEPQVANPHSKVEEAEDLQRGGEQCEL